MKRILFVAEAVTLAQVVRLVTLARTLDPAQYEIHFASACFGALEFAGTAFIQHPICSLSPEQVARAVTWGTRIYSRRRLAQYLDDDLRLLDKVEPDLVVGDLRWSLLVSAPLRKVPHAALINAYWSPYRKDDRIPLPDHPMVRLVGERLAGEHFEKAWPWVSRHFARPLNALRRRHGFAAYEGLLELLDAGDATLYPDAPGMIPMHPLPHSHHFLGPVLWAPDIPSPTAWERPPNAPVLYVTLGSSGNIRSAPALIRALAQLPVEVCVATAGRYTLEDLPSNVTVAEYLPGDAAARRADLVICNGGSSTGYQALAHGKPVIGIPFNLDQYLAMGVIERMQAGLLIRAGSAKPEAVARLVKGALDGRFFPGAIKCQEFLRVLDPGIEFRRVVHQLASPSDSRKP